MPVVNKSVTRAAGLTPVRRDAVKAGEIFQVLLKGVPGRNHYGALGHNGKSFSINLGNGELASTGKMDKKVVVVGKFSVKTSALDLAGKETTRGALKNNAVFRAKGEGKESIYLNLGKLTDGKAVSINMAKPFGEDYASTSALAKGVVQVGTWSIDATITK